MNTRVPEYNEAIELIRKIAEGPRDNTTFPEGDTLQADLDRLMELSQDLCLDMEDTLAGRSSRNRRCNHFSSSYQRWYSESCEFLHRALPARLDEFMFLYQGDPKRKSVNVENFSIRDYLLGVCPYTRGAEIKRCAAIALEKLRLQAQILESARVRFESTLANLDPIMMDNTDETRSRVMNQRLQQARTEGMMVVSRVIAEWFPVFK